LILLLVFLLLISLLIINVPVAFALGVVSLVYMWVVDIPHVIMAQQLIEGPSGWVLLAMPLFVVAGGLMNVSTISRRIIDFAGALVGHIRGGLAMINIMASMLFGGISGSSVADTAAIGSVLIPGMMKKGYPANYSAAITSSSATIGIIIPPSIVMIFYGVVSGQSVGTLFIAGILPGIMVGFGLMAVAYVFALIGNHPKENKFSLRAVFTNFRKAFLALVMPIIVVGGIIFGIFTPTEAGAIAVMYSLIIGIFVFRAINFKKIYKTLVDATILTSIVMIVIATSLVFGWIMSHEGIPQAITRFIIDLDLSRHMVLIVLSIVLIVLGTFLHGDPIMFLVVPMILPVVQKLGIDLIFFGILVCFAIGIGQQTPPVGSCLFVTSAISGADVLAITKVNWAFIILFMLLMVLMIFLPEITLLLPRMAGAL
jgi:tripartite ATP-independent transporter DctM subunit